MSTNRRAVLMAGVEAEVVMVGLMSVVNVASVPQRSPFRYPGGKTWLVPHVRAWLGSLERPPEHFLEPFLGGGIISLTVAFEQLASHVQAVELDEDVAAVWECVFSGRAELLASRILSFDLEYDAVKAELARPGADVDDRAFRTILRNRVLHGGILAPGAGLIKQGENGKGLSSRWYPETLAKRLRAISEVRSRFTFSCGDGLSALENAGAAVCFIDPPYTAGKKGKRAGKRLYAHNEIDHEKLFSLAESLDGDFLMTYDNDPEVVALAERHGFQVRPVSMKNTHHAVQNELLIGRNLEWAK